MPEIRDASCPHCASRNLRGVELDDARELILLCLDCASAFEPELRQEPASQMCNNCAFRPNSQERADPWRFLELLEVTIEGGQPFHCHKGLKIEMTEGGYRFVGPADLAQLVQCAGWRARLTAFRAGVPLHRL